MNQPSGKIVLLGLILIAVTTAVFLPVLRYGFVNWDDPLYILDNPRIRSLAAGNIFRIFTVVHPDGGYEPLTELTYAVEYRLFGLEPFVYHLTNLVLHLLNVLLVFRLVFLLGRHLGVAFIAALLFGVHPLRVESVVWLAERKDVLYGFFLFSALIAYCRYLRSRSRAAYLLCLTLFFFSLLPKTQGVLFPVLLLLFDYYFRRRLDWKAWREKLPFAALAALVLAANVFSQVASGNLEPGRLTAAPANLPHSAYGLVFYLGKLLLPVRLSAYYPYPEKDFVASLFVFAPALLAAVVFLTVYSRRYTRKVIFAALFFLFNTLLVLQVVSVGPAIAADRYTYVAAVGLAYLAAVGLIRLGEAAGRCRRAAAAAGTAAIIVFFALLARRRCGVWENSLALWDDVLAQYRRPSLIHLQRGLALGEAGRPREAIASYREALRLEPGYLEAHNNLGIALVGAGRMEEALDHYREVIRLQDDYPPVYNNLGLALEKLGRVEEAAAAYRRALELAPELPETRNNLGYIYYRRGDLAAAIEQLEEAVRLRPEYVAAQGNLAAAHNDLGVGFSRQGDLEKAISHYREALRIRPEFPEAHNNLGVDLATLGRYEEAIRHYLQALAVAPGYADAHNNLGLSLARQGRRDEAVFHYTEALRLNPDHPNARANLETIER